MTSARDRLAAWSNAAARAVFGDRVGLAVFLAGFLFLALTWRVGFFINDNYTIANAYVAVAHGHLDVRAVPYGPPSGNTPGMHLVGGRLYGRNYGQLVTALPFLWALEGLAAVADVRIALAALWSLGVLALFVLVGEELTRPSAGRLLGSAAALCAFVGNVWVATDLGARWLPMLALQVATMAAAALCGVVLYRLLAALHDRRVGVCAGLATVVVSPVAFWAAIPKRHALSTLFVLVTLYAFYRSRGLEGRAATRAHAVAYASTAGLAWTHAAEGTLLFVALLLVDLATAPLAEWSPRRLAFVGGSFLLALVPLFVTNYAISGNPLAPPRLLPGYDGTPPIEDLVAQNRTGTSGTATGPEGGASDGGGVGGGGVGVLGALASVLSLFSVLVDRADLVQNQLAKGLSAITDPTRLYHVFVRSGWLGRTSVRNGSEAITLTVLESLPLTGALVVLPLLAGERLRRGVAWTRRLSPERATDALAVAIAVAFTLIYLPTLPLYAQITPRYLLPLFPLIVYGVARLPTVRRTLRDPLLVWTYAGGVLVGGQLLLVWVVLRVDGLGEAVQLHAVLHLALAGVLVAWLLAARFTDRNLSRVGAVVLGLCGAAGTLFVLFARVEYFSVGEGPVLPLVRAFAQYVHLVA